MNRSFYFLFLFVFFIPSQRLQPSPAHQMIIWNVGQGSWASAVDGENCFHFDMGGEFYPQIKKLSECYKKRNFIFISHFDYDHTNFIRRFSRQAATVCFVYQISDRSSHNNKLAKNLLSWLKTQKFCEKKTFDFLVQIIQPIHFADKNMKSKKLTKNEESLVFIYKNTWLFSGDSPRSVEKIWSKKIPPTIQYFIVGHHGSRTSTSKDLLFALPHLRQALVSARKKRYGHPHAEVIRQIANKKIPLIETEKWGHLIYSFN